MNVFLQSNLVAVKLDERTAAHKLVWSVGKDDGLGEVRRTDGCAGRSFVLRLANSSWKLVQVVNPHRRLLHLELVRGSTCACQ